MAKPITMIELFSGIGAQERALRQLKLPYDVVNTCDCDTDAVLSYAAMRWDLDKEMETFEFPSQNEMIEELQAKNLGFDFQKGKHKITSRTPITKLKQYYIADKLSKNLGDVSKVESLPYVDIICHTSPCQDYSLAGKGAGGDEGSNTRSSLMWESLRLIESSKPKFVLWENVAAVLSGKHRHNFIKYLEKMSELGYENAFDLLNGKNFGIPQNRLRIFCVSRRVNNNDNVVHNVDDMPKSTNKQVESTMKEIRDNPNIRLWTNYKFPEIIELETRLKDILEKNVDEKFYLPDDRIEKILNTGCGIKQSVVTDEIKIVGNYMPSGHDASRVVDIDGIAPTVKENHGTVTAIAEPHIIQKFGDRGTTQYSVRDYAHTIPANPMSDRGQMVLECEPQVLRAERTEYGKAIRKQYEAGEIDEKIGNMREMKPRTDGIANTVTTVLKDNYVIEAKEKKSLWTDTQKQMITEDGNIKRYINSDIIDEFNVGDCADISFPNGYNKANRVFDGYSPAINGTTTQSSFVVKEPIIYDDYNSRISADQDAINTLTCNCGASAERNGVKIIEPVIFNDETEYPCSTRGKQVASTIRASIYKQGARNIEENIANGLGYEGVIEQDKPKIRWRIRKLTSKECWRLMNFTDRDHDRAAKYVSASSLYKQAGNSIVVACLIALMSSIFVEDGYKSDIWTKYALNYND